MMFSKKWWGKTVDRLIRAGAYTLTTLIGTDQMGWATLDPIFIGRTAALVMLLSFLGSIITTPLGPDEEDPSTT